MQLLRTTIRIQENLKKAADKKALEENRSFQDILNHALQSYLEQEGRKKAKKIIIKTHHLGEPLDNLTRSDYYSDTL